MTPEQAISEAREQKLRPVYLIVGNESYFEAEVVRALGSAALAGGIPGLNEDRLQASETSVDNVLAAARTLPMLAKRRLVLVRGLEHWQPREGAEAKAPDKDPLERLLEYAKNPAPSTTLVLVGSGLDKRRRLVAQARTAGWLVSCDAPSRADLPGWIEHAARARGNAIAPGIADLIAELAGPELAPIADAVERLSLYAGDQATITEEAVLACVVRLRARTVWELVAAVSRRDVGAALSALHEVYDPQDRGLRLVGLLAWSARQLLRFESAIREGASPTEAATRAGAPPFKARELSDQIKRIPRAELEHWLETLAELDFGLKGGSRRAPKAQLEYGILKLCRSTEPPRRSGFSERRA